jgi:cytidylate kinase
VVHEKIPVITIDGPSGSGKGTVAKKLAEILGWHFLDSGSLYRILAYLIERQGVSLAAIPAICQMAQEMDIVFASLQGKDQILLEKEDISTLIRTEKIGQLASEIAAIPLVRSSLLQRQRRFQQLPGLVADGRDMGTVIFPDANLKIYLVASAVVRAQRRVRQLTQLGMEADFSTILVDIEARDLRDTQRSVAPLRPATDAIILDNSSLSIEEALNRILALVSERKLTHLAV